MELWKWKWKWKLKIGWRKCGMARWKRNISEMMMVKRLNCIIYFFINFIHSMWTSYLEHQDFLPNNAWLELFPLFTFSLAFHMHWLMVDVTIPAGATWLAGWLAYTKMGKTWEWKWENEEMNEKQKWNKIHLEVNIRNFPLFFSF